MSDHLQTHAATGLIKSLLMASNIAFWVILLHFQSLLTYITHELSHILCLIYGDTLIN